MTTRLEAVQFKKTQSGKIYAVRLGSAVPNKNGDGYNIYLDAIPAPEDGQYKLAIVPQRQKGGGDY